MKKIVKGAIGNALTSVADDHVVAVTHDIYDEVQDQYQEDINQQTKQQFENLTAQIRTHEEQIGDLINALSCFGDGWWINELKWGNAALWTNTNVTYDTFIEVFQQIEIHQNAINELNQKIESFKEDTVNKFDDITLINAEQQREIDVLLYRISLVSNGMWDNALLWVNDSEWENHRSDGAACNCPDNARDLFNQLFQNAEAVNETDNLQNKTLQEHQAAIEANAAAIIDNKKAFDTHLIESAKAAKSLAKEQDAQNKQISLLGASTTCVVNGLWNLMGLWDNEMLWSNDIMDKVLSDFETRIHKSEDDIESHTDSIARIENLIANLPGNNGDWSKNGSMNIPIPNCAILNLHTDIMPTAKSGLGTSGVNCDIPCEIEFWDQQGNYAKIWSELSAQGNSSMAFVKKNLAFDLFTSSNLKESYEIKFGDWVPQDSFHLKAYYTDAFRGVGACSYALYEEMVRTRSLLDDRPYKEDFTSEYTSNSTGNIDSLSDNFDTGAKCFPAGFPVIVYQNGEFYGIYSWQIKKSRENMHMNKKNAQQIHLDGTLGTDTIWNGNINWGAFEVRNPKSLILATGKKYNGDFPAEIIGTDSVNYDNTNDDMKQTAIVKESIIALSHRMSEFKSAEAAGTSREKMRELIARYFKVSFMVDYILETNVVQDGDGYTKNWQWTTWDGVRWTANPYDHDGIFGAYHIGNYVNTPGSGWLGNSLALPSGWIIKYFLPELKSRYAQLRSAGVFTSKNITSIVKNWLDRIGEGNFELEYKRWPESPCYRESGLNDKFWKRTTGYINQWSSAAIYGAGTVVYLNGQAYRSLKANNMGHTPTADTENWVNVTYNPNKTYVVNEVCYYGQSNLFGFSCIANCKGEAPLVKTYSLYPKELGHYDSVYRIQLWLDQRIGYMDKLLTYSPDTVETVNIKVDELSNTFTQEKRQVNYQLRAIGREQAIQNNNISEIGEHFDLLAEGMWGNLFIWNNDTLWRNAQNVAIEEIDAHDVRISKLEANLTQLLAQFTAQQKVITDQQQQINALLDCFSINGVGIWQNSLLWSNIALWSNELLSNVVANAMSSSVAVKSYDATTEAISI